MRIRARGACAIIPFALVLLLPASIYLGSQRQANTAKRFIGYLIAGNVNIAYEETTREFRGQTNVASLERMAELPQFKGEGKITFSNRHYENGLYTFTGSIKGTEKEGPIVVQVMKEDGEWRVVFFSVDPSDVDRVQNSR